MEQQRSAEGQNQLQHVSNGPNPAQVYYCFGCFVAAAGHVRHSLDIRCGLFYCCHYNSYAAIAVVAALYLLFRLIVVASCKRKLYVTTGQTKLVTKRSRRH